MYKTYKYFKHIKYISLSCCSKKYIENWLFGAKKTPLENRLETLELSVQRCIIMLEERDNLLKSSNAYADQQKEFSTQVHAELMSIKKLLLNRYLLKRG